LNLMQAATGNNCKFMKRGVAWHFWLVKKTLMLQHSESVAEVRQCMLEGLPREHYNSPVWIELELGQVVKKYVPIGRA